MRDSSGYDPCSLVFACGDLRRQSVVMGCFVVHVVASIGSPYVGSARSRSSSLGAVVPIGWSGLKVNLPANITSNNLTGEMVGDYLLLSPPTGGFFTSFY